MSNDEKQANSLQIQEPIMTNNLELNLNNQNNNNTNSSGIETNPHVYNSQNNIGITPNVNTNQINTIPKGNILIINQTD